MKDETFINKYPLKTASSIIAPLSQHHFLSKNNMIPFPNLNGMYELANYYGIAPSSVRVTICRLCSAGRIYSFTDDAGTTRYQMDQMMTLISEQAARFGKSDGLTLAVFRFSKEEDKQRYRVREILNSFGFKMLAQNVYLNIRVDIPAIQKELAEWGLKNNVFMFDCTSPDDSIMNEMSALWDLENWKIKLDDFIKDLQEYWDFAGLGDREIYLRYSIGYSAFFVHIYEKHPAIPFHYLPEGYPLSELFEFVEKALYQYEAAIVRYYTQIFQ